MRRFFGLVMSIVMVLGLTACGNTIGDIDLKSGESALYIQKDGMISYGVCEDFGKDYYSEKDLKKQIEAEVESYNSSNDASVDDAVSIDSFDVSKKVATLCLDFATTYDLTNYMHNMNRKDDEKFYIGTIEENEDCDIEGEFIKVDNNKTVKAETVQELSDSNILIADEQYKVQIDGKVTYISSNCKLNDDGTVTTAKTDDGLSYIVYELD